ncbi:MAG: HEAT repeat domain-containing protein [Planctomycetes bacterium]|nr:HEAT repeat domain-containing protein [Planctomycetota bacterium]
MFSSFVSACLAFTIQEPTTLDPAYLERARAHYETVELELRARTVDHLDPARRAERERLLDVLLVYRERGEFGRCADQGDARIPQFVDRGGRRCAVAELLHASGRDGLVELVRTLDNDAWVLDLECNQEFLDWLDASGLSIDEAARIQLPAFLNGVATRPWSPPRGDKYAGPGDVVGGGSRGNPTTPAPTSPSSPSTPGTPAGPSTPGAPSAPNSPVTARAFASEASDEATWWMWWEYNKLAYLHSTPLEHSLQRRTGELTGAERRAAIEKELDALRRRELASFGGAVRDGDPTVRGEALIGLARVGATTSLDTLRAALEDRSVTVRHRAILALGECGSPAAFELLVAIARHGATNDGAQPITARAREFAVIALGLGRRAGAFDVHADREVFEVLSRRDRTAYDPCVVAALVYHTLAPSKELESVARVIARDEATPTPLRARAIESLSSVDSSDTLSLLQHWLSGRDVELRRSAALALGRSRHDLALPPMLTAFEIEAEPLTKGFLLVSIGEQGGEQARAFLLSVLAKGASNLRPWAALGLGVLASSRDDPVAREALRRSSGAERNADGLGAHWIASGLARDAAAVPQIARALATHADPRQRMYAATALALIDDAAARAALRERIDHERSPLVRVALAQALGHCGEPSDAPSLFAVMGDLREPNLQGLAAVAMAFHGSDAAVGGLAGIARAESTPSASRAAALNGLGMLLGRRPPLVLSHASRHSNYTLYEDWLQDVLQVSL